MDRAGRLHHLDSGALSARILVIDIETAPSLGYFWSLWKQNIALNQIKDVGTVISFAAKWRDEKRIRFHSDFNFETETLTGHAAMVEEAWCLLDEADIVVHWNGESFDIPHLNREFILAGERPPSPFKQVDLLRTTRKQFQFVSNKLDHVAQQLGVGAKVSHTGFDLWRRCMDADPAAWRLMRKYNIGDVKITDKVYDQLMPWVTTHPHVGLYSDDPTANTCGRCGGKLQRRGYATTNLGRFQRFQCQGSCRGWSRSGRRVDGVDARPTG